MNEPCNCKTPVPPLQRHLTKFILMKKEKGRTGISCSKCGQKFHIQLLRSQIHHVHVRTEAHVICQVPAHVIRIFVDHDLVRIPQPVAAIPDIDRRNAEIKTTEPESPGPAAPETPYMPWPEAAAKMPVLPRMVEMEAGIHAPRIVSDPVAVLVHMRGLRMAWLIVKVPVLLNRMRITFWCGPVRRRRMHLPPAMRVAMFAALRERQKAKN